MPDPFPLGTQATSPRPLPSFFGWLMRACQASRSHIYLIDRLIGVPSPDSESMVVGLSIQSWILPGQNSKPASAPDDDIDPLTHRPTYRKVVYDIACVWGVHMWGRSGCADGKHSAP